MTKCEICGKCVKQLRRHFLKAHKDIDYKTDYYDRFLKTENDGICCVCGAVTNWKCDKYEKTCSVKCHNEYVKMQTEHAMQTKYGVKNCMHLPYFAAKVGKTYFERTGFSNPSKNPLVVDKIKNKLEKEKQRAISLQYWKHVSVDEKHANVLKMKNTKMDKYGSANYNNRNKSKITCLAKYGVEHIVQTDAVKDKIRRKICGKRKTDECKNKIKKRLVMNINDKFKQLDPHFVSYKDGETTWYCDRCGKNITLRHCLYYQRLHNQTAICTVCNPIAEDASGVENVLYDTIREFYDGMIVQHDRSILNGKELDIYIPDKNLAIEFDGLYWHDERHKENTYHLKKTQECAKKGIQCIHIFEDEWRDKHDIVLSRLKSLFGLNKRVFARKCAIRQLTYQESIDFLEENHIQGNCVSKYRYGLFYDNELVSVMTFGKSRFKDEFELLRFANKLGMNVIGGAGKLFKHFLNDHPEINAVVSFADKRWSVGNLYEKLNFFKVDDVPPNYYYILNKKRRNRIEFQKHKLVAEGYDASKSEHEIMIERNIFRIYDCGNLKYEWRRNGNC